MLTHGYYESSGKGRIHYCAWNPEGKPKAVVQVVRTILAWGPAAERKRPGRNF